MYSKPWKIYDHWSSDSTFKNLFERKKYRKNIWAVTFIVLLFKIKQKGEQYVHQRKLSEWWYMNWMEYYAAVKKEILNDSKWKEHQN